MAKKTLPDEVTIPASIEEDITMLNGIHSLFTAKGWLRAATVCAYTTDQQGSQTDRRKTADRYGINEFAQLGINGLTHRETVRNYRNIWIKKGTNPDIKPGDKLIVPDIDFPETRPDSKGSRISTDPKKALMQILAREKTNPGYLTTLFDLMEEEVDSTRLPSEPTPVSMAGSSVTTDVGRFFTKAAKQIEKAVERLDAAISHGTRFEAEEFQDMANQPEWTLDPELLIYRKTVAMVVTHEVEV